MTIFATLVALAVTVLLVEAAALAFRASFRREQGRYALVAEPAEVTEVAPQASQAA